MYEQMAYLCKNLADISDRFCFITSLFDLLNLCNPMANNIHAK